MTKGFFSILLFRENDFFDSMDYWGLGDKKHFRGLRDP